MIGRPVDPLIPGACKHRNWAGFDRGVASGRLANPPTGTAGVINKRGDVLRVRFEMTLAAAEGGAVEWVLMTLVPEVSTQEDLAH